MMNIKRNIFLMLAASVLLASCSQDELMTDTGHDGLVPVTLSAAVGDGVQTRAATDGVAERCVIQILEKNGEEWQNAITNLESNPASMNKSVSDPSQFVIDVMLNPNKEYTFLFWADEDNGSYVVTDLQTVRLAEDKSTSIAWQGKATWNKTEESTITANLTHAVAKVTLHSTTAVENERPFVLSNLTEYNGFDVMNGTANGDIVTPGHKGTGTGASGDLLSFYALVTGENQELKLTSGEGGGVVSIPNVPLAPNTHVILKGDVQGAGWTTVNFTANIDGNWGSTPVIGEGYEIDGEGNFTVTTAEGLQAWATAVQSNPSLNCTLADNITLPEVTDGDSNWMPIPNFTGTFDGNNKTITGLTINQSTTDNIGLFTSIAENGTVKNLTLDNVDITAGSNVGAVAGLNRGTIENCSVSGSVTGSSNNSCVGGIAGWHSGGTITDCHSSATVKGIAFIGGIAGQSNASITACYSTGSVTATINSYNYSYAGGVVGMNNNGAILTACYATGNVEGEGISVGGVVGDNEYCTVTACYHATGSVIGASGSVGGVAGRNFEVGPLGSSILNACYWNGTVTDDTGIGEDRSNVGEATKVEGDWTDAVSKMNAALADNYGWEWTIEAPNALPTLKKKETI